MTIPRLALLLILASTTASTVSAADIVLSDNLDKTSQGDFGATTGEWQAQRFLAANQSYTLVDVTLLMRRISGTGNPVVQIYSNNTITGYPDVSIATLTTPGSYSGVLANTTFTPSGTITLNADSIYWVVLKGSSGSEFAWSWTSINTGAGDGFSSVWSTTLNSGASWVNDTTNPYQMRIRVQAVPEPSSMILMGLGMVAAGIPRRRKSRRIG